MAVFGTVFIADNTRDGEEEAGTLTALVSYNITITLRLKD